jgi:hypothetical protein
VKERPILFSAPMVRAILKDRKTQTRRILKLSKMGLGKLAATDFHPEAAYRGVQQNSGTAQWYDDNGGHYRESVCPYGMPGDRLWVKETHAFISTYGVSRSVADATARKHKTTVIYKASPPWQYNADDVEVVFDGDSPMGRLQQVFREVSDLAWKPSIHMPRWASRLTLEIVSLKVERVQDISEGDIIAEGCPDEYLLGKNWYRPLWDEINGIGSWEANPWVWVVEFKRVVADA